MTGIGRVERLREAARIVLQQLCGAGRADQHHLGTEPLIGLAYRVFQQRRGVAAEVAGLERRVGDRRSFRAALDHREEKIGIGVALRRMQNIMDVAHRGGDPHRAHMGRPFICPQGQLHGSNPEPSATRQRSRKKLGEVGAWS